MEHETKTCQCCGAKLVEYHHFLSRLLVNSLVTFWEEVGSASASLKDTRLSFSERTNFQKLRYWGLVVKGRQPSTWSISSDGRAFLKGLLQMMEHAVTFRGELVRLEGRLVTAEDVVGHTYQGREDYAREATPIKGNGQQLSLAG